MLTHDEKQMMLRCADEIELLRRRNDLAEAQLSVLDVIAAAIGFRKADKAYSEDIAWKIRDTLQKAEKKEQEEMYKNLAKEEVD